MKTMLGVALSDVRGLLNDLLEKLSGEGWELWLSELKRFLRKEPCWTRDNPYLRKIAGGMLPATNGKQTMVGGKKMFPGCFDSDFVNWGTNVPGKATPAMPFDLYELVQDGKFTQIFGGFNRLLGELCWEQDKILAFVEGHPELLHLQNRATFFLFKVGDEFFVVYVYRRAGRLGADVHRLSDGNVWLAEYRSRFVVPQLALAV